MISYTPIKDVDQKIDIIDHVNQDHPEEILAIARNSQSLGEELLSAKVLDIFEEGVRIEVQLSSSTEQVLVPFQIEGEPEDQILYLAYSAIVKEGRDFSGNGQHFFEVTDKRKITENIVRLTVKSDSPLPDYYPGYAYAFVLKTFKAIPQKTIRATKKKPWSKRIFDLVFIWLMKHLSPKNRQKLLQNANKDIRLYTLRKAWKNSEESEFSDRGYIDIFTHGNTAGSQWADSLCAGDLVMSRSEATDKHPHLANGQALLIADETAYPAIAGILEHWKNPLPPELIILSACHEEQKYFAEADIPEGTQIHKVICSPEQQADKVLPIIKTMGNIDVTWAAFEADSAKKVRHYLRNERQIIGKNNHTKAYWRLKSYR